MTKQNRGQCQFAAGAKVFDRIQNMCSNVQLGMYLKYVRIFIYLLLYFKVTINCVATVTITYIIRIRNTALSRLICNFHFRNFCNFHHFQMWNFLQKSKVRASKMTKIADFDLLKLSNLI